MHVAQIPIIRKQLVSSRLQHAEKNPNITDIHTWAEITTGRTLTIAASCKSCLWASLWNCVMEQWSIWQVVFQVTRETILQHIVMACQHSWAWNGDEVPGSCITEIFLLSFAATEWELFLLTHQQRGRRWGKAVRDCHIELLAWNACIKLEAGQKFLNPKLFSHQAGICVTFTQKPVTRDCCNHNWVVPGVCILSLTVCITPLP